ncbi:hypothetical protein V4P56_00435 [Bartonella sp. B35(2025)]
MPKMHLKLLVNEQHLEQGGSNGISAESLSYTPFEGICLTNTFQLSEDSHCLEGILAENNERRKRQFNLPITVIVGNPPYSAGQKSENDGNKNLKYPQLDNRIAKTYIKSSQSKGLKRSLYDPTFVPFSGARIV